MNIRCDGDDETVAIEVELPRELLSDIDQYATRNGYDTPSAVVTEALHRSK